MTDAKVELVAPDDWLVGDLAADKVWNAIMHDPRLKRARSQLSLHEIRLMVGHAQRHFSDAATRVAALERIAEITDKQHWEVVPCKDRLGNAMSYDICLSQEPGSTGVAVVASVYSGEEVANQIAALWNAASAIEARRAETQGGSVADESAVPERQTPEPSSIAPVQDDDAEL